MKASARRRKGMTLLAAMLFLLAAVSFHSSDDNDIGSPSRNLAPAGSISRPTAADTCPACALDGVLLARLSFVLPIERPLAAEPLVLATPISLDLAPRPCAYSRPPPPIA
ncbi:MAG: hypothetical protein ACRD16_09625 [Thermoanaerobaculia bacterium]